MHLLRGAANAFRWMIRAANRVFQSTYRELPASPYVRCESCRQAQATVEYRGQRLCDHCYNLAACENTM